MWGRGVVHQRDVFKRLPIIFFQKRITATTSHITILYNLYHDAVRISNNLSPLGLHRLRTV